MLWDMHLDKRTRWTGEMTDLATLKEMDPTEESIYTGPSSRVVPDIVYCSICSLPPEVILVDLISTVLFQWPVARQVQVVVKEEFWGNV